MHKTYTGGTHHPSTAGESRSEMAQGDVNKVSEGLNSRGVGQMTDLVNK